MRSHVALLSILAASVIGGCASESAPDAEAAESAESTAAKAYAVEVKEGETRLVGYGSVSGKDLAVRLCSLTLPNFASLAPSIKDADLQAVKPLTISGFVTASASGGSVVSEKRAISRLPIDTNAGGEIANLTIGVKADLAAAGTDGASRGKATLSVSGDLIDLPDASLFAKTKTAVARGAVKSLLRDLNAAKQTITLLPIPVESNIGKACAGAKGALR